MAQRVTVTRDELETRIGSGEIDTVVMVFPDHHGRLVGKRTTGRHFLRHVGDGGTENCDYLLACDIDNDPSPGYALANYESGYGDMVARGDWSTVRITPWLERTAMVICDLFDIDTGAPIEVAPRQVLRRQVERAAELGYLPMVGSEIEFFLFQDSYREAHDSGYRALRPHSPWVQDYHTVQTAGDELVIGQLRRGLEAAGVPVEFSKGEAGRGQHEINLDYATPVEMADRNAVYKHAAREIAALNGRAITFMAKYDFGATGSSCHVHSSLWTLDGTEALFDGMTPLFRRYLAGLLHTARDFALLWAPTINSYKRFQTSSWAPTTIGWGVDNRTVGFRVVGHGPSMRVECRIPGSDANSYLAFAGTIAGGLYGIRHGLELPPERAGNAYTADELPRIPTTIVEAIELWERSDVARECFGDEVHGHVLAAANAEWRAFNQTVTDWELRRYFERA